MGADTPVCIIFSSQTETEEYLFGLLVELLAARRTYKDSTGHRHQCSDSGAGGAAFKSPFYLILIV